MRADAMLDKGNMDGRAVWRRVPRAIELLLEQSPPGQGDEVH